MARTSRANESGKIVILLASPLTAVWQASSNLSGRQRLVDKCTKPIYSKPSELLSHRQIVREIDFCTPQDAAMRYTHAPQPSEIFPRPKREHEVRTRHKAAD
eukprot:6189260-Pleurochrysis_carterae.AAC.2